MKSRLIGNHVQSFALTIATVVASILIFTSEAKAAVVYTPENIIASGNGILNIDLNNDGVADVNIVYAGRWTHCILQPPSFAEDVYALPASGDATVFGSGGAVALNSGAKIGPGDSFYSGEDVMMSVACGRQYGNWVDVSNRYLGIRFLINGHIHYGWARMSVYYRTGLFIHGPVIVLTGYAYETVAGRAITAGQTTGP